MKYLILYYSGSGNTQRVAQILSAQLRNNGAKVTMKFIKKGLKIQPDFDRIIVGSPVYAYSPPRTVMEILSAINLPFVPVYMFFTKGLILGNADVKLANLLKSKGLKIIGKTDFLLADSLFILSAQKGSLLHYIYLLPNKLSAKKLSKFSAKVLQAFDRNEVAEIRNKWYVAFTDCVAKAFWKKEKEWQSEMFADEKCDLCGACVGLCPRDNIEIRESHVIFGDDCDFCMRCLHRCPKEAIQIGRITINSPRYRGI